MGAGRPPSDRDILRRIQDRCSAIVEEIFDLRILEVGDPGERKRLRLRKRLELAWMRHHRKPDSATERRAGYTRKDPAPWHSPAIRLQALTAPLLQPRRKRKR